MNSHKETPMQKLYETEVLADSISDSDVRITTVMTTFPRFVLAELNTHRMFSRNAASSRAIPVEKRIQMVSDDPVVPLAFTKNQRGMQADEDLDPVKDEAARMAWIAAKRAMVYWAGKLAELGVHKQHANRLLEPFSPVTVIITATEWANFFALRCHPNAQPEMRMAAESIRDAMDANVADAVGARAWHLPLVRLNDLTDAAERGEGIEWLIKLSVARCARVSYLTHEGIRDPEADIRLYETLRTNGHMSPFEHAARPLTNEGLDRGYRDFNLNAGDDFVGNFRGWVQHRKELPGEAVFFSAS